MSGRTTPSGIRPPSGFGFATPGTPTATGVNGSSSGTGSRLSYNPAAHHTNAHARDGVASPPPKTATPVARERAAADGANASNSRGSSSGGGAQPVSTSVQVALRIRPPPGAEAATASNIPARFQRTAIQPVAGTNNQLLVESPNAGGKGSTKQSFSFDRVFGYEEGQAQVYACIEPLVKRFQEGYNVTVLAYGQTSSGKSYSMGTDTLYASTDDTDVDRRLGIIPRAVRQIFQELEAKVRDSGRRLKVDTTNSYVEIYNEDLIDLLVGDLDPSARPAVTIREDKSGHIIWSGLQEMTVGSVSDVMRNLEAGSAIRQTGSTAMNDQSSRSHAVFSLTLTQRRYVGLGSPKSQTSSPPSSHQPVFGTPSRLAQRQSLTSIGRVGSPTPASRPGTPGDGPGKRLIPRPSSTLGRAPSPTPREEDDRSTAGSADAAEEWTTVTSKFHFVDLAGSERLKRTSAMGDRQREGISINAGLLALGNVISALGDPAKARQTTHIPYRDSKLTRLLQDSLGGNAHTMMIACVSPVEYNLSETLNTLKYANRARNIKNRAEVNETEVGWEDVDHLQQLVLRLRGDLQAVKSGASMPSITEGEESNLQTGVMSSHQHASAELVSLQEQYADLSTRYAKLTTELVKAQSTPAQLSAENFAMAIEPVVEEYEKSISALESQLSLTKAALGHAEDAMREKDDKLTAESQIAESHARAVAELQARVAKQADRENVTESYIRDLESRMREGSEKEDASSTVLVELRREVARYKDVEENSEKYIRDLEAKLVKSSDDEQSRVKQLEALEADVRRREKAQSELEDRLSLLDSSDQQKQLLAELDERDRKMQDLQRELEAAQKRIAETSAPLSSVSSAVNGFGNTAHPAAIINLREASPAGSPVDTSLTPPQTPSGGSEDGTKSSLTASEPPLRQQLQALQAQHAAALAQLDKLSAEHELSRDQLRQLQSGGPSQEKGLTVAAKSNEQGKSRSDADGSPESALEELEELHDDVPPSILPPSHPSYVTPTRASRSSRRSMPLSPRGSFLGRTPASSSSGSHLRSVSLSQELSLAQASPGGFGSGTLNSQHMPKPPNTASGKLQSGSGALSPRSTSPLFGSGRRNSLLFAGALAAPDPPERSNESLTREVQKLQATLEERDDEIRALELSLSGLRAKHGDEGLQVSVSPAFAADEALETPDVTVRADPLSLSPKTLQAFTAMKASIEVTREHDPGSLDDPDRQMARLEDLMLSMAKKEVVHRETVDSLDEQLATLRRQHDDLKTLSNDQVHNMSLEISSLRLDLSNAQEEARQVLTQLTAQRENMDKLHEEHTAALASLEDRHRAALDTANEQHEVAKGELVDSLQQQLADLEQEHATLLQRMLEAKEELFMRKASDYDAKLEELKEEHGDRFREAATAANERLAALQNEHDAALEQLRTQHSQAVKSYEVQLRDSRARDDAVQHNVESSADIEAKYHVMETALRDQLAAELARQKEDAASIMADMGKDHESAIADLVGQHAEAVVGLKTVHSRELQELRAEHAEALSALSKEASSGLAEAQERHTLDLRDLAAKHELAISAIREQHTSVLEQLHSLQQSREDSQQTARARHQEALVELNAAHEAALASMANLHAEELATAKLQLDEQHREAEGRLVEQAELHNQALTELRKASVSSSAIEDLERKHAAALAELKDAHQGGLSSAEAAHGARLSSLRQEWDASQATLKATHEAAWQAARSSSAAEVAALQAQLDEGAVQASRLAEEVAGLQLQRTAAETDAVRRTQALADLHARLETETSETKAELDGLRQALDETQKSEAAIGVELQETLDALGTLEKALMDSQDERERLMGDIRDLQLAAQKHAKAQAELDAVRRERDDLVQQKETLEAALEAERAKPQSSSNGGMRGLGIDVVPNGHESAAVAMPVSAGLVRAGSSASERESSSSSLPSAVQPAPPMQLLRHSSVTALANGGHGMAYKPPPTPPPSMPPPPLPVEVLSSSQTISRSSSQDHNSDPRASLSSVFTKDSMHDTPLTSQRTYSDSGDTISVDPRVHRKLDEQEAALGRLTKRLEHCETELKANIDLVTTLESALNDSERNLRKSRLQMNDLAKERDNYANQNSTLRQQMQASQREVDNARHSLQVHEQEMAARIEAQKKAQSEAQRNAELRMEEMMRANRKSKFNCF